MRGLVWEGEVGVPDCNQMQRSVHDLQCDYSKNRLPAGELAAELHRNKL